VTSANPAIRASQRMRTANRRSSLRSQILGPAHLPPLHAASPRPSPVPAVAAPEEDDKPSLPLSHYISWSHLLKKTFEIDTVCPRCKTPLRLIAMIETEDTIKKILSAMGLPCSFGALGLPTLPPPHAASPRPSPRRPNSGPHDRLPRNLVARAKTS
jgi:hypothetical protein